MSRTLTIAEAAAATGLTVKAIRNRVDRGQLRALKSGGVRRIPIVELQRAGLLEQDGTAPAPAAELGEAAAIVNRELLAELAKAHERIGELTALEERSESTRREELARAELELERERERARGAELELERIRNRSLLDRIRNR